ncbi:MAG TPA: hypothetical protein VFZ64_06870 [Nocardioidaceae bacterium]
MPATDSAVLIPARYCGPTSSGNGGYTAGLLAERFANHPRPDPECPVVEATLRRPPPLETRLEVEHLDDEARTRLLDGKVLVAEARCTAEDLTAVEQVPLAAAAEAMRHYPGLRSHPFPRCFVCGPEREEGDGLRIFPGPVGDGRVASAWVPHESLAESSDLLDRGVERVGLATAWAALDCVGGWATDLEGRPMVLGQIAARVDALPVVGEHHVVMGVELSSEGRKTFTASTVYDSDGRIVARARHTWIAVDPAAFT